MLLRQLVQQDRSIALETPQTQYVLERFLFRLSETEHRKHFVLKGGLLMAALIRDRARPTEDLDLHGMSRGVAAKVSQMLRDVAAVDAGDGIAFAVEQVKATHINEGYIRCVRLKVPYSLHTMLAVLKVDIGFGDSFSPREVVLPSLLDHKHPPPAVLAYNVDTVVAEKIHAGICLGLAGNRIKDYYDLLILARTMEFDAEFLSRQIADTFRTRATAIPVEPVCFGADWIRIGEPQWRSFLVREAVIRRPGESFAEIIAELDGFLRPALDHARDPANNPSPGRWDPDARCWSDLMPRPLAISPTA
jgi:predicted nucleotidyltransferase component of viral defense system